MERKLREWALPQGERRGNVSEYMLSMDCVKTLFAKGRIAGLDECGDMEYYIYSPIAHGADPNKKYPLIFFLHGSNMGIEDYVAPMATNMGVFCLEKNQGLLGNAYIVLPRANEKAINARVCQNNWTTNDPDTGRSRYIPSLLHMLDTLVKEHQIDERKIAIGGVSAGAAVTWQLVAKVPERFACAFPLAPSFVPSDEELLKIDNAKIPIWVLHCIHDELIHYEKSTGLIENKLNQMSAVRFTKLDWVRHGDYSIVSNIRGAEMGQHNPQFAITANMIYEDGKPYDERYPEGFIAWLNYCFER